MEIIKVPKRAFRKIQNKHHLMVNERGDKYQRKRSYE